MISPAQICVGLNFNLFSIFNFHYAVNLKKKKKSVKINGQIKVWIGCFF